MSAEQRLLLHQLRTLEHLEQSPTRDVETRTEADRPVEQTTREWELTRGVELYDWQRECVDRWFAAKGKGTIKVVTGAGKTLLALAIAERLQRDKDPDLRVAIVVPTIVLMEQWYADLLEHSNLERAALGRLGGGFQDGFSDRCRILVAVLASASQKLPQLVREAGVGEHLLLVVDECHRAGAAETRKVLKSPRAWSLGLSATPESEDDEDEDASGFADSVVGRALGKIVYEMNLADALERGLLPPFRIRHYGLPLTASERNEYDRLTRQISDVENELRELAPPKVRRGAFFGWLRTGAQRGDTAPRARHYLALVDRRRRLLFGMRARREAVHRLLSDELGRRPDARAIVFHEHISEVNGLFLALQDAGLPVIAEHSDLPESLRADGIRLFREGMARVIVSARSLIEGFNVPAADVGIIAASSKSVRQRIQSLGRVLRRHRGPEGEEKTSVIHVLYARDTVDEILYEKVDWRQITGATANEFYVWDAEGRPIPQEGPPRRPSPRDDQVDVSKLEPGDVYPGRYEGDEYTCDAMGNVTSATGQAVEAPADLAERVRAVKGSYGRFRVTRRSRHILVRIPGAGDEWLTLYVGRLDKVLKLRRRRGKGGTSRVSPDEWARAAKAGEEYPFEDAGGPVESLTFSQRSGGVIKKKVRMGELYARVGERASDPRRGADAQRLLDHWRELRKTYPRLTKFHINKHLHAVFREGGRLRFLCALDAGLEFPEPQEADGP